VAADAQALNARVALAREAVEKTETAIATLERKSAAWREVVAELEDTTAKLVAKVREAAVREAAAVAVRETAEEEREAAVERAAKMALWRDAVAARDAATAWRDTAAASLQAALGACKTAEVQEVAARQSATAATLRGAAAAAAQTAAVAQLAEIDRYAA